MKKDEDGELVVPDVVSVEQEQDGSLLVPDDTINSPKKNNMINGSFMESANSFDEASVFGAIG